MSDVVSGSDRGHKLVDKGKVLLRKGDGSRSDAKEIDWPFTRTFRLKQALSERARRFGDDEQTKLVQSTFRDKIDDEEGDELPPSVIKMVKVRCGET